jgi:hypothetical protein
LFGLRFVWFVSAEFAVVRSLPHAQQDISIGDRRHRNDLAALDQRCEIEVVLAGVDLMFFDLGNLCSEKPVALFVMLELRRNLQRTRAFAASIGFDLLHRAIPRLGIK